MPATSSPSTLEDLDIEDLFQPRDLEDVGVYRSQLQAMVERGEALRIARGVYLKADSEISEHLTVAAVCKRVPDAVVCLLSALRIHEIGTQNPSQVWIAIDRKARKPKLTGLPVRVVRFSGSRLRYGVETREIMGVPVRLTSPARTVVDCFRYRRKIGLEIALEALSGAVRDRKATVDEILRAAEVCGGHTIITPYLEALSV